MHSRTHFVCVTDVIRSRLAMQEEETQVTLPSRGGITFGCVVNNTRPIHTRINWDATCNSNKCEMSTKLTIKIAKTKHTTTMNADETVQCAWAKSVWHGIGIRHENENTMRIRCSMRTWRRSNLSRSLQYFTNRVCNTRATALTHENTQTCTRRKLCLGNSKSPTSRDFSHVCVFGWKVH